MAELMPSEKSKEAIGFLMKILCREQFEKLNNTPGFDIFMLTSTSRFQECKTCSVMATFRLTTCSTRSFRMDLSNSVQFVISR